MSLEPPSPQADTPPDLSSSQKSLARPVDPLPGRGVGEERRPTLTSSTSPTANLGRPVVHVPELSNFKPLPGIL